MRYDRLSPLVSSPDYLVVSVADLRAHLRIEGSDEDGPLDGFLRAAIGTVDGPHGQLGRVIVPGRFALYTSCPPRAVGLGPVREVTEIARLVAGDYDALDVSVWSWSASSVPGQAATLHQLDQWPEAEPDAFAWRTTFEAGAEDVPPEIRAAILMRAAFLFGNRGESNAGGESAAIAALLSPYRLMSV